MVINMVLLRYFKRQPNLLSDILSSVGLISICATIAIFVPEVQVVFGLAGSTLSVSQMYLFPAVLMLKSSFGSDKTQGKVLLVFAIVIGMLGTGVTIQQDFF